MGNGLMQPSTSIKFNRPSNNRSIFFLDDFSMQTNRELFESIYSVNDSTVISFIVGTELFRCLKVCHQLIVHWKVFQFQFDVFAN